MSLTAPIRLRVLPRLIPIDGKNVELRSTSSAVEWRNEGDDSWQVLVPISELTGPAGPKGDKGDPGQDGTMTSVQPGDNVSVDASDPANPVISVSAQIQATPLSRAELGDLPDYTSTAHLMEQGFQGQFLEVDASDYPDLIAADTVGGEIKVKPANPNLAYLRQRKYGDLIKTSEFGHDLAVALAVAGERRKMFGPGHRVDVYANLAGTQAITKGLVVPTGVNFFSDKALVLDASAVSILDTINLASGVSGAGGGVFVDIRPEGGTSLTGHYSEPLPAWQPIAVGDIEVAFDEDIALKEGDVLVWYDTVDGSWNPVRPEYRLSMRRRVTGVDGRKIYIDKPARDEFVSSSTLTVRKQETVIGRFGGFKLDLSGSNHPASFGVVITGLDERSEVSDIVVEAATYGGIAFNQCRNIRPYRLRGSTLLGTGKTAVYPINILNSTDVRIRDSEGVGDWHSLAMGGVGGANLSPGATINEDTWYDSCKAYNSGYTAVPAIEMHGNTCRGGFLNCEAAAAVMAGRDPSLINGRLDNAQTKAAQNTGRLIFFAEAHSGRFHVQGTTMRSVHNSGLSSLGGAIYYSSEAVPAKGEVFIDIEGVFIDAPYEVQPVRIGNSLTGSDKVSFSFDGSVNLPAATRFVTVVNGNTDVESSYFRIERAVGLKPGTSWAVWLATGTAGAMTFASTKFPAQRYVLDTAGAAVASELLPAAATQALRHPFPVGYQPTATAFLQSGSLGLKASARIASLTTSAFRAQVATDDGSNYSAAVAKVAVVVE